MEPQTTSTGRHVFVSYVREDQTYARKLENDLGKRGFETWMDERIESGNRWWQTIVKAIRASAAFVVVMTPESEESEWVEREVMLALDEGKPVFPLLLRGKGFPLLGTRQYADVTGGLMPPDDFYEQLEGEVRAPSAESRVGKKRTGKPWRLDRWPLLAQVGLMVFVSVIVVTVVITVSYGLQAEQQRQIENKRATALVSTEIDRSRETALQNYYEEMRVLLLDGDLLTSKPARDLARTQTLNVLRRLDGERKGLLIQFLYELELIQPASLITAEAESVVSLSGADLGGADLSGADLSEADLSGAYLFGADLRRADLWGADLRRADLRWAELRRANLHEAGLWGADLRRADLSGANLFEADLFGLG